MTPADFHAYLVRLAMEAWDWQNPPPAHWKRNSARQVHARARAAFLAAVTERLAQAAQVYAIEEIASPTVITCGPVTP